MSTPHVAGLAGLIWSRHYTYTVSMVTKVMIDTAVDVYEAGWDERTGWGRIDAQRALSCTIYTIHLPLIVQNQGSFDWPLGE